MTRDTSPAAEQLIAEGLQHHRSGRLGEAEQLYRRVLETNPRHPESLHLLGMVADQAGDYQLAIDQISRAIAFDPAKAIYHVNLGTVFYQRERLDEAIGCYRHALTLKPDYPDALYNLGNVLRDRGLLDEAVVCYRDALALKPDYSDAHNNLGNALADLGRLDEAFACFRKAIDLRPNHPEAHGNLGSALRAVGRLDEAFACYRKAIDLRPDYPDVHHNLAMLLLSRGEMAAGWVEYEWRWRTPQLARSRRAFSQPQWRGEAAEGRTLLIHAEQGFGDTLQFCRYASLAAARGLRVIMEVPKPLARLLVGLAGVDRVVPFGEIPPPFDLHCPMLSMPLALGTVIATIPGDTPYLRADEARVANWRTRLTATDHLGPRIGLVWAGNARAHLPSLTAVDRRRSMAPDRLAPLFDVPGLQFFSLQKDGPAAPEDFALTDCMDEMEDFADTAALIANLDLVISVDTAVAHLAAALGKPVWLLDRSDSCWRWLTGRRDSPWYPTLRLYHQTRAGDWDSVLAEVTEDLRSLFPCVTGTRGNIQEAKLKLNLGCGQNKREGYVNVDKFDSFAPDVVWDLETLPWPFDSNSVDEIVMRHSLEHLGARVETFLSIMRELYRVSSPDAKIHIAVPHPRSDGFAGDPTHVRAINPAILSLFSKKKNREWKELGWPNTPLAINLDVDFDMVDVRYSLTAHWLGRLEAGQISIEDLNFALGSYFNVVDEINMTLVVCK